METRLSRGFFDWLSPACWVRVGGVTLQYIINTASRATEKIWVYSTYHVSSCSCPVVRMWPQDSVSGLPEDSCRLVQHLLAFFKRNWDKLCFLMICTGFILRILISVPTTWIHCIFQKNTKNVLLSFDVDPHPSLASYFFNILHMDVVNSWNGCKHYSLFFKKYLPLEFFLLFRAPLTLPRDTLTLLKDLLKTQRTEEIRGGGGMKKNLKMLNIIYLGVEEHLEVKCKKQSEN